MPCVYVSAIHVDEKDLSQMKMALLKRLEYHTNSGVRVSSIDGLAEDKFPIGLSYEHISFLLHALPLPFWNRSKCC